MQNRNRHSAIVALLLFSLLSLVLTWPLARTLSTAVEDRQDALLNVWITAWDGHQLLSAPLHLFDANIFHPYPRTLAYSELLLGNGLLALPLSAATGNPILGYNVALLLSFLLTAFGTYLLVFRLTRSAGAGLVAGTILAFCSFRMTNLAQAQLLTTQWLPLTLLALHELLRHPRPRHVLLFILFFCLQALSSFYYGILLALAVLLIVLLVIAAWLWQRLRRGRETGRSDGIGGRAWRQAAGGAPGRVVLALLLAAICCFLILLPFTLPYFRVQSELGFERSLADSEPFSASLRQYVSVPAGSLVLGCWLSSEQSPLPGGYPADALFPGLVSLILAGVGLMACRRRTRWLYLVLLLVSFILSLGPRLYLAPGRPAGLEIALPYAWLYAVVPGFKALRAPVRFDVLVMLALAVLAGYGVAALGRRLALVHFVRRGSPGRRSPIAASLLAGGCLLLVALESSAWPAAHAEPVPVGDSVPASYRWLVTQPATAILELPMAFTTGGPQLEYQYLSTTHWHTTPDGYSGFVPPKHGQVVYEMERFPGERSVSLLQALGVEYVLIHTGRYAAGRWQEMQADLAQADDLALLQVLGTDQIYRVRARSAGTAHLAVTGYLPQPAAAGRPYTGYLVVTNQGPRSYAIPPTQQLALTATWTTAEGSTSQALSADLPLVTSPAGGAAVVPLILTAPSRPGTYHLAIAQRAEPLGPFSTEGQVVVGDQNTGVGVQFPVPAQLTAGVVPPTVRRGRMLEVEWTWRALGKIDAYYSIYVKLLDAAGNAVAGWDGQPQGGTAPTLHWVPGTTIADQVALVVPSGIPPGDYTVEVGMYRASDLARAMTLDAAGVPLERVTLGTVRVEP